MFTKTNLFLVCDIQTLTINRNPVTTRKHSFAKYCEKSGKNPVTLQKRPCPYSFFLQQILLHHAQRREKGQKAAVKLKKVPGETTT